MICFDLLNNSSNKAFKSVILEGDKGIIECLVPLIIIGPPGSSITVIYLLINSPCLLKSLTLCNNPSNSGNTLLSLSNKAF